MAEAALNQDYFTPREVEEIIDHLMNHSSVISADRKVAATQILNMIHILRGRLGVGHELLRLIYTDETRASKPIAKFMEEYLNGKYRQKEAEEILSGLEADMRQNYFQRKIPFDDTSKLPRTMVFDPMGDFTDKIKKIVEKVVAEYDPAVNAKAKAEEIYKKGCDNLAGKLELESLAGGLAEIIARKDYPSLVLSIGARDPTSQEIAGRYLIALDTAYRRLGVNPQKQINRERVLEERTNDAVYRKELEIYKENLGGLLIV